MSDFERGLTVRVSLCIVVGIAVAKSLAGAVQAIGRMQSALVSLLVGRR
jgi:ACR3 family arsenite efflux pump ArsB